MTSSELPAGSQSSKRCSWPALIRSATRPCVSGPKSLRKLDMKVASCAKELGSLAVFCASCLMVGAFTSFVAMVRNRLPQPAPAPAPSHARAARSRPASARLGRGSRAGSSRGRDRRAPYGAPPPSRPHARAHARPCPAPDATRACDPAPARRPQRAPGARSRGGSGSGFNQGPPSKSRQNALTGRSGAARARRPNPNAAAAHVPISTAIVGPIGIGISPRQQQLTSSTVERTNGGKT